MMETIIDNATPLLWCLGAVYFVGMGMLWSCLAMRKRAEERK